MNTKMNVDNIKISGMSCASCAKAVERAVQKLDSSVQATVNMATEKLSISYDKEKVKSEDIEKAIEGCQIVMITVPGMGIEYFAEILAPVVKEDQIILINSAPAMASVRFVKKAK